MTIDSTSLYSAQALTNYYRQQLSSTSSDDDSSSYSSQVSLLDYLASTSTEDTASASLSDIQMDMQSDTRGQMNKFKMEENEEMEAFKTSADAITEETDEDLTTDEMAALLSSLQENMGEMTPEIASLTADTDISALSDDEITSLFEDVQSSLEEMKANGPEGMGPPPPEMGMDSTEDDEETEYTLEDWYARLQETLSSSETYSASDIDAAIFDILKAV